ncbi:MAG TPA: biosynthetic peptidoglycan transglycosylase [Ktedonobacterales bacterium]|nr:biosynthetic peptidoglycan transglycosylase [Ktedonobacterales bacterium]
MSISEFPAADTPTAPQRVPLPDFAPGGIIWRGLALRAPRLRVARRSVVVSAALLALVVVVSTWAWLATPSTDGLLIHVRRAAARHHTPYIPLGAVAPVMRYALVASEDQRFFQHKGIDVIGIARAMVDDARAGAFVEGGSTLTAQLAKNAYLDGHDHTIPLKLEDLVLALKVEQRYDKSTILEMYLNLTYYGEGAYGIGAAAQRYFGVAPAHLTLAQAAILASLVQAPGAHDPWCHPQAARVAQDEVLERMVRSGYITEAAAAAALADRSAYAGPGGVIPHDTFCGA